MYPVIDRNNIVISWHPAFADAAAASRLVVGHRVGKMPMKIPPFDKVARAYVVGMNLSTMDY